MARSAQADMYQGYHFLAYAKLPDGTDLLARGADSGIEGPAGFTEISIPNVSTEIAEYREGHMTYTRKQPGIVTVGDSTFSRGIARKDVSFYRWSVLAHQAKGDFRSDVEVHQFHRAFAMPRTSPIDSVGKGSNRLFIDPGAIAGRIYYFNEAFPSDITPGGQLSSTSSDISMQEMTLTLEHLEIDELQ